MDTKTWGRVQINAQWRPASLSEAGEMFVSPSTVDPWRFARKMERATWQARHPDHQDTVGRIWDDELYPQS